MMSQIKTQFNIPNRAKNSDVFSRIGFICSTIAWIFYAAEEEESNRWRVCKVSFKSSTEVWGEGKITQSHERILEDVSLQTALSYVGEQERKFEEDYNVDFGEDHIISFAGQNGFVFDVNGKAHALHNGRPVTSGEFTQEAIDIANKHYNIAKKIIPLKGKKSKSSTLGNVDMSVVLNPTTAPVPYKEARIFAGNFLDFLPAEVGNKENVWRQNSCARRMFWQLLKLVNCAMEVHFHRKITKIGMLIAALNRKEELSYKKEVAKTEKYFSSYLDLFPDAEDEVKIYRQLLNFIQLSLDVSDTKELYQLCEEERPSKALLSKTKKHMQKTIDLLDLMGASREDKNRIYNVVMDRKPDKVLDSNFKVLHNHCSMASIARIYFFPSEIEVFFNGMAEALDELEIEKRKNVPNAPTIHYWKK